MSDPVIGSYRNVTGVRSMACRAPYLVAGLDKDGKDTGAVYRCHLSVPPLWAWLLGNGVLQVWFAPFAVVACDPPHRHAPVALLPGDYQVITPGRFERAEVS